MVRQYSNIGLKLCCPTFYALGVNMIGMLQFCDGCAISKAKAREVMNKMYTRASKPGERIIVETTGPFPESLIGNRYCIVVVDE